MISMRTAKKIWCKSINKLRCNDLSKLARSGDIFASARNPACSFRGYLQDGVGGVLPAARTFICAMNPWSKVVVLSQDFFNSLFISNEYLLLAKISTIGLTITCHLIITHITMHYNQIRPLTAGRKNNSFSKIDNSLSCARLLQQIMCSLWLQEIFIWPKGPTR